MNSFAAFALSLLVLMSTAQAAPTDVAPLPDDVVQRLLHGPYSKPNDGLAGELAQRLDETAELLRLWEAELGPDANVTPNARANRGMQLEAQAHLLGQLKAFAHSRLAERKTQAVAAQKNAKMRAALAQRLDAQAAKMQASFDQVQQALTQLLAANTQEARRARLHEAKTLLHALRGQFHDRELVPSTIPWPTQRLGIDAGPSPRKNSDTLPRYLSEQQSRYLNSFASTAPILLAAAPTTPTEAGQCYSTGTVDTADLAATPDVSTTDPEVIALAEKLGYSPAKVLAWVHDNIKYEPYWGSLKGAKGTLVSGAGNATDQASLMIALLRASNIPSRYVSGRIQINESTPTQPGGRALKWLGAKTYLAAARILSMGGVSAGTVTNASAQATGISLDHVWVEACVPYTHYRGAAVSNAGHRWVPLDGSFKDRAYRQDINVDVAFDYSF